MEINQEEPDNSPQSGGLNRLIDFLCRESLPRRISSIFSSVSSRLEDPDHVSMLRHHPLGMFFYNLRFMVLLASGGVLLVCAGAGLAGTVDEFFWKVWFSLTGIWSFGVLATFLMHRNFRATLDKWALAIDSDSFPGAFRRYFLLDSILVILVFALGRLMPMAYRFDAFCWLLLANTILYTGYDLRMLRRRHIAVLALPAAVAVIFLIRLDVSRLPRWLSVALQAAPVVAACVLSVFAVYAITRARRLDTARVDAYMATLGAIGVWLAPPQFETAAEVQRTADYRDYREEEFHARIVRALGVVCRSEHFWFRSACLWLVEQHTDRKEVLILAAYYNVPPEFRREADGIEAATGFLAGDQPVLVRSLRSASDPERWRFRTTEDIPAALIPIRTDRRLGVLVVYGEQRGVPVVAADATFLASLGTAIGALLVTGRLFCARWP